MVALQASTKIWGWRDATGAVAARKARSCRDWSLEARPAGRSVVVEGEVPANQARVLAGRQQEVWKSARSRSLMV